MSSTFFWCWKWDIELSEARQKFIFIDKIFKFKQQYVLNKLSDNTVEVYPQYIKIMFIKYFSGCENKLYQLLYVEPTTQYSSYFVT